MMTKKKEETVSKRASTSIASYFACTSFTRADIESLNTIKERKAADMKN